MKRTFSISGMTCQGCVQSVKNGLEVEAAIVSAEINLEEGLAEIEMKHEVPIETLQLLIGHYKIETIGQENRIEAESELPEASFTTYRPLILIFLFILGSTLLSQFPFEDFSFKLWMRHFMAGFFLVFSFFKLLNIQGFARSYAMYDIVANQWKAWGFIYPFVELTLGILYLTNLFPFYTNIATILILGVSSIGVIQSNLNNRKIKCACLGDVFNLPMSTVTIVEDLTMVGMALLMLAL